MSNLFDDLFEIDIGSEDSETARAYMGGTCEMSFNGADITGDIGRTKTKAYLIVPLPGLRSRAWRFLGWLFKRAGWTMRGLGKFVGTFDGEAFVTGGNFNGFGTMRAEPVTEEDAVEWWKKYERRSR